MLAGSLQAEALTLSPKWVKTVDGYLDSAEVYLDGAIHVTTYTEEPYAAYYARINPYGRISTFYRIKGADEVYGISLTKGKFSGIGYNESSEKEFVNVYSWSGRLLWTLEEPENCYYSGVALTKYGNMYILMGNSTDNKVYLLKYDSMFKKVYEKEILPVVGSYDHYYPGRLFVGEDDSVYVVLSYWQNIGCWVWVSEVQKISSDGARVWATIFSGTSTIPSSYLYYYVDNIREVSGKVFVGVRKDNATYYFQWILSTQGFVFMLDSRTGSIMWKLNLPEIVRGGEWPYIMFDVDVSSNKIYTLYSQGYSWDEIVGAVLVIDFNGNIVSAYSLNLPIPAGDVWILRATRDGQVYLLGSRESYTYVMGLGRLG
jgi:hypothetical protein